MTLEDLYRLMRSGHVQAQGIVDTLDDPLLVLDEDLRICGVNPAYLRSFRVDRDEVLGQNFFGLAEGWRSDELRRLMLEIIPRSKAVVGYEVDLDLPGLGSRTMCLSARRLVHPDNSSTSILLMLEDVTEVRRTSADRDILLAETQHRMKNLLAVVRALVTQTKVAGRSAEDYRSALLARLAALTDAQEMILAHGQAISLRALVERSLAAFPARTRIVPGPDVQLAPVQVVPMSFVFYELAANAAKYGALSAPEGNVEISWTLSDRDSRTLLSLDWTETGGPPVTPPDHQGFGSRLIAFSVTNDLGGSVEQHFDQAGLRTKIEVPLT